MIADATNRTLQNGSLTFSAWEMGDGPLALCLHGFPDTPRTWRLLLPALAEAGYRAVAVTARGYEASSQPLDADYSTAALAGDVPAWLDSLGADRCHLIGHDWGASIAYAAAAGYPERIMTLTTLAVPHPAAFTRAARRDIGQILRSWYMIYFQMRERPERVLPRNDFAFLEQLWRAWSPGWEIPRGDLIAMKQILSAPGALSAALGYYRAAFDPRHPRAAEGRRLFTTPIQAPVLGLTGERDGCISPRIFMRCLPAPLFAGGITGQVIEGAGHFLALERPEVVNSAILCFLNRYEGRGGDRQFLISDAPSPTSG